MTETPVRGANPEPSTGWPWCLTEYEIDYVSTFGVRPRRDINWTGTERDEQSLDQEAQALLSSSILVGDINNSTVPSNNGDVSLPNAGPSVQLANMAPFTVKRNTYMVVTGVLSALIVLAGVFIGISVVQVSNLTDEISDLKSRHSHDKTSAKGLIDRAERRNYDLEQALTDAGY